jgi:hypothetical protein
MKTLQLTTKRTRLELITAFPLLLLGLFLLTMSFFNNDLSTVVIGLVCSVSSAILFILAFSWRNKVEEQREIECIDYKEIGSEVNMIKNIKPEDRFVVCKNIDNGYCKIKKHNIENGNASLNHCKMCKYFVIREKK